MNNIVKYTTDERNTIERSNDRYELDVHSMCAKR